MTAEPTTHTRCATLHTDGHGNLAPCPGHPELSQPELHHCPHCTDAVVDLDDHLETCTARKQDQLADAQRLITEHEKQQTEACLAEIEQVLAKYGRKLVITQPQLTITPQ